MTVYVNRLFYGDVQTRGLLSVRDEGEEVFSCVTVELPWKENRTRVSCIPPGPEGNRQSYYLRHRGAADSSTFNYPHFILRGVPGRRYILFHRGNFYFQVAGCILPGRDWVDLNDDGHPDVTDSTETLREMRDVIPDETEIRVGSLVKPESVPEAEILPTDTPDPLTLPDLSRLPELDQR